MSAPEVTSSVTPPAPGWAKPFPRDERVFLWLVLASVVAMTVVVLVWLWAGGQNVPREAHATTPKEFSAQVATFAKRYGGTDGRVYVPAGTDAYLLASRYTWYPELVLESGRQYRIWLSSADALHGFALVGQNLNLEVAPNHAMGAKLTVGKPGRYLIVCNEFCGLGHERMMGHLNVITPQAMQAYLAAHPPASAAKAKGAAPAAGALRLAVAGNQLKFDKPGLTARAGKVTIDLTNASAIPHNVAIKGNGVNAKGPIVTSGHSSVSAVLKPGTYIFYCTVPGHEQAGMRGTLTVKP